jgi:hypothetical protein
MERGSQTGNSPSDNDRVIVVIHEMTLYPGQKPGLWRVLPIVRQPNGTKHRCQVSDRAEFSGRN